MTKNFTALLLLAATLTAAACLMAQRSAGSGEAPAIPQLAGFPRGELTIEGASGTHHFDIWVADTVARRSQGLMFVQSLPKAHGMLFLFGEPQPVSMWMKNTLIPLDMLFVAADGRVTRIAARTEPQSLDTIESGSPVTAVLELGGGECERLGIRPGDRLRHAAFTAR